MSIGGGSNPYFFHYLSSISRGKSVHLVNPDTVTSEIDGLLSVIDSPFCKDLTVKIAFKNHQSKFEAHEMVHPHPISDLYKDHAVLLKVTVPKGNSYQMQSIEVKGTVLYEDGLRSIEIPVTNNQDDMELNESFAMDLALAESRLNHLHSNIWLMDDLSGNNTNPNVEKWRKLANEISDETGISSPTRSLQSSQEALNLVDNAQSEAGNQNSSLKPNESLLTLPPRTGCGHRRKKEVSNKKKGAAVTVAATMGSVAVVDDNPFGGDDSIFGVIGETSEVYCGCCVYDRATDIQCDDDNCCTLCFMICCLFLVIIACFVNGVLRLNDAADYQNFIDSSTLTECELVSYNASICMNISATCNSTDWCGDQILGYEYVYQSFAYDLCGDEPLWSHRDDLECGTGNSSLKQMNESYECTIVDCDDEEFYFGNEDVSVEELRRSTWIIGFWLIFIACFLLICCPLTMCFAFCLVYCGWDCDSFCECCMDCSEDCCM